MKTKYSFFVHFFFLLISSTTLFSQVINNVESFVWVDYYHDLGRTSEKQDFFDDVTDGNFNYVLLSSLSLWQDADFKDFAEDLSTYTNLFLRLDLRDDRPTPNTNYYFDDSFLKLLYDSDYLDFIKDKIQSPLSTFNGFTDGYFWEFQENFVHRKGIQNYDFGANESNWNQFDGTTYSIVANNCARYYSDINNNWNGIGSQMIEISENQTFSFSCEVFIHEGYKNTTDGSNGGPVIKLEYYFEGNPLPYEECDYIFADTSIIEETQYLDLNDTTPSVPCDEVKIVLWGRGRGIADFDNINFDSNNNSLINGDFEQGELYWSQNSNWKIFEKKKAQYSSAVENWEAIYQTVQMDLDVNNSKTVEFSAEVYIDEINLTDPKPVFKLEYYDTDGVKYDWFDCDYISANPFILDKTQVLKGTFTTPSDRGCDFVRIIFWGRTDAVVYIDNIQYGPDMYTEYKKAYYAIEPEGELDWNWPNSIDKSEIYQWVASKHTEAENIVKDMVNAVAPGKPTLSCYAAAWLLGSNPLRQVDFSSLNTTDHGILFWLYDYWDAGSDNAHANNYAYGRAFQDIDFNGAKWYMNNCRDWEGSYDSKPYEIREFASYALLAGFSKVGWWHYRMDSEQTFQQRNTVKTLSQQMQYLVPTNYTYTVLFNTGISNALSNFNEFPGMWSNPNSALAELTVESNHYAYGYDYFGINENTGIPIPCTNCSNHAYEVSPPSIMHNSLDNTNDATAYFFRTLPPTLSLNTYRNSLSYGPSSLKLDFINDNNQNEWHYAGFIMPVELTETGGEWSIDVWLEDTTSFQNQLSTDINEIIQIVYIDLIDCDGNRKRWYASAGNYGYIADTNFDALNNFRYTFKFGIDLRERRPKFISGSLLNSLPPDYGFRYDCTGTGGGYNLYVFIGSPPSYKNQSASFYIDNLTYDSFPNPQNSHPVTSSSNLSLNYPNPFNPITQIKYSIKNNGLVTLKVYDILGAEVKTLVNEVKEAGSHSVEFNAANLPSGIYFFRIQAGGFVATNKMILLK